MAKGGPCSPGDFGEIMGNPNYPGRRYCRALIAAVGAPGFFPMLPTPTGVDPEIRYTYPRLGRDMGSRLGGRAIGHDLAMIFRKSRAVRRLLAAPPLRAQSRLGAHRIFCPFYPRRKRR